MLLRFSVENFLSFKNEVSLSLVASADDRHPKHLLEGRKLKPQGVLRAAGIYGANGHGKTNFVHAIKFARDLILRDSTSSDKIRVRPYKSLENSNTKPTTFVFNFSTDGVDYEYGLAVFRTHVAEEWLFSSPKGREVRVFERITKVTTDGNFENIVELGTDLRRKRRGDRATGEEFLQFVAAGTSPLRPFLSEAVARNVKALRPAYDWFRRSLQVVSAESDYGGLPIRAHEDAEFIEELSSRIREAGIGIDHIETSVRKFDLNDFKDVPQDALDLISKNVTEESIVELSGPDGKKLLLRKGEDNQIEVIDLLAVYKRSDGKFVKFSQDEESSGTRRLINLFPMLISLARSDKTFIIDELDRKLHPVLSYHLLQSFFESSSCGQLLFTTHNTHLLDLDLFRRDEIWFAEKDGDGVTDLYSLIDLKVRPDVEIRRGYLKGRFGAIPFLGNIFDLGWAESTGKNADGQKKKRVRSAEWET